MNFIDTNVKDRILHFSKVGQPYILDRGTAMNIIKELRKQDKKRFRIAHHINYSNIWRTK